MEENQLGSLVEVSVVHFWTNFITELPFFFILKLVLATGNFTACELGRFTPVLPLPTPPTPSLCPQEQQASKSRGEPKCIRELGEQTEP
jgi:hypothetical protein